MRMEEQTDRHQLWAMKDYRMIILRSQTFVNIQKSIEENHGHEATAAFYEAGIDAGRSSTQALLSEWKERNMDFVERWAEFYGPKGVGWFVLNSVKTDEGLCISELTITESFVAESYGRSNLPVCHFLAGFFVGTFKESCGMNLLCEEIECVAMGHSSCKFSFESI